DRVAERLGRAFACRAAVVDINDLGGDVLGCWPADMDRALLVEALSDNPLGQGCEGTPVGILSRPPT
ncbi:MAG TPA: hypothetical protein P5266_01425, partial [Candidatus Fermentibacter sp.]|nr:hypothetical protein [Candidatus Fermentibacter sp.]